MGPEQIHAMPVESPDLEGAARQYASTLREIAGSPPTLDVVHMGLGPDGHTASLVPGEPVLNATDVDCGCDRCVSRKATNDIDISDHQSCPSYPMTGDGS
jgi:6-phosphogluconolactonase/glucosamine-6-phosphate isomerase/deaminase